MLLDDFLDSRTGVGQILSIHNRAKCDPGVVGKKAWLDNSRYLRCVLHIENNKAAAFAVCNDREIRCFGL